MRTSMYNINTLSTMNAHFNKYMFSFRFCWPARKTVEGELLCNELDLYVRHFFLKFIEVH